MEFGGGEQTEGGVVCVCVGEEHLAGGRVQNSRRNVAGEGAEERVGAEGGGSVTMETSHSLTPKSTRQEMTSTVFLSLLGEVGLPLKPRLSGD